MKRFDNYYKRRICRIYPSVFACLLFVHTVSMDPHFEALEFLGGNFIKAIMIYYILLWLIRKYAFHRIPLIFGLTFVVSLLVYLLWFPYKYEVSSRGIYGITTRYRWIPYFGFMLMGAYVGLRRTKLKYSLGRDSLFFLICLFLFYGIQFLAKEYRPVAPFQIVTLLPLLGIVFYFYKICNAKVFQKVYWSTWGNRIIMLVSGICLESYLIQHSLFTDKMNAIWPLNIIVIFIVIIFCSYMVRCFARLISQTFQKEDYQWKRIVEI